MSDYSLEMPFWIDTDGYTDRDRSMFVAGAEFMQTYMELKSGEEVTKCITPENEDRCRMMCAKLGRHCIIGPTITKQWLHFHSPRVIQP